ncbi:MAG TPA: RHS repeat-associated core domain-containing protein [Thermoanaerobaculia bacterium]|nr:RHS repeat-associated core domain-containing protein [Thermoanaerobaculia bacterium]
MRERLRQTLLGVFCLTALLGLPLYAGEVAKADLDILGLALEVDRNPVTTAVDVPAYVQTKFGGKSGDEAPPAPGMSALGELTGPGIDTPITLVTTPGRPFALPALHEKGEYALQNIRLVGANGEFLQQAIPSFAIINVSDVLKTEIRVRQLTPEELRERGIQIDSRNYEVYGRVVAASDEFRQLRDRDSGNTIRYFYDGDGRLARVVDPVGRESTLTWDRNTGLLKEISDWHAAPRRVTYAYDGQRRLTSVQLPEVAGSPRATIGYAYAKNLESITDPGATTHRVKFDYDASDRVTKQTWGTGESATFIYGATVDVTDVLGQLRRYTLTTDRAHVSEVHEMNVPVWNGAAFGQLPGALSPGTASMSAVERVRRFAFDNGVLTSSKLDGVRETSITYQSPAGAPGLVVSSISGDGITRGFRYQTGDNGSTFLEAIEAGGKRIESPAPHRNNLAPVANNSGIAGTESFETHGLPLSASSSGGTDSGSAGAKSRIEYWPVTAPPHARAMPHFVRDGDGADALTTTIEYPSDTQTKQTDPRGVVTTTEVDEWNRPVHMRVEKPGDPLVLEQRFFYDAAGRLARRVEKKGSDEVTTTLSYDVLGRATSSSSNQIATVGTVTTTTQYDLANRRIITTHPGGATTATDLDPLGRARRSVTATGSSPIETQSAFDLAGNRVYSTDLFTATAAAFDAHGRAIATKAPDGTVTRSEYDEWDRPKSVKSLATDGATVAESSYDFTDAGRLRSLSTRVDAGLERQTSFAWDGAGRTTRFATNGRASKSVFDVAGRMQSSAAGAGDLNALSEIFSQTNVTAHDGAAPSVTASSERGQPAPTLASMDRNAAGDVVRNNVGSLEWNTRFDELGNVTEASVPGRPSTKFDVDARGAVEKETLADGAANQFAYHGSGAQTNYTDPTSEATGTQTDLLGRPLSRSYPDGTSETIQWEGARVRSIRDRQNREQEFIYNAKGQLEEVRSGGSKLETLGYDNAGRLVRWTNADAELTWSDFDLDGNPKKTTQKRFRDASGFSTSQQVLNEFVQEHRWNEHGERTAFTISGTQTWIEQAYDAMGNLTSISRAGTPLMTATYRGAGRPQTRTVFTSGAPIVRTYAYDDATSLLKSMTVTTGANVVAGANVAYDGLQKSAILPLGVASPVTNFTYDARSRLVTANRSTQVLTPSDFRTEEQRAPQLDDATRAALQARGIDTTTIDPPSSKFTEQTGHKIKQAARGPVVRPFGYNGAERADDGRFTYEFDVKGRLIRATEKSGPGRYDYQYSATGRLIGRGDTTFVWDPISDRLIAVVAADGTVQKQIIHGDAAYDDPLEVTTPSGRLFPIFDEAGAGTMQAVLNDRAEVVARNVPNDPYGAEDVAFTGAAIDRVAIKATKNQDGTLNSVEVTIHATEALALVTVASGARLTTIDNKSAVVRSTTVTPTLADPFTLHWTLTPPEWQALVDPAPVGTPPATRTPIALSIAATATLRAAAWSSTTPILPPPDWVLATRPIHTSSTLPVEIRESLTSLTTFLGTVPAGFDKTSTLYSVDSLPLLGTPASDTLFEDVVSARFQALPFQDPGTGLVYARGRWYDPGTGAFLTPDPLGYRDSSNLYSFCGGDPINCRDPRGESAAVSKSGAIIGIRADGKRYRFGPGYGQESLQHRIEVQLTLEDDKDLSEADVRSIMARAGLQYGPTSFPCLPGETCLRSAAPPRRGDYVAGSALRISNTTNQILGPVNEVNGERPFPTPDPENERQRVAYERTGNVIQAITVPAAFAGLLPRGARIEMVGDAYNISTAGMSQAEREAVIEYARRTNAWMDEAGTQVVQSTKGSLRRSASAAARRERIRAERAGEPYAGQVGHVPDTAISGQAEPPAGWLDMPGTSNQCCGGGLSSRLGQPIRVVTVDGRVP